MKKSLCDIISVKIIFWDLSEKNVSGPFPVIILTRAFYWKLMSSHSRTFSLNFDFYNIQIRALIQQWNI